MEYAKKTYVRFLFIPHYSFLDDGGEEVKSRDILNVEKRRGSYGFYFFDNVIATVDVGGAFIEFHSEQLNRSSTYYYNARIVTLKQAEKEFPGEHILIHMQVHNIKRTILTCVGSFCDLDGDSDIFIETEE